MSSSPIGGIEAIHAWTPPGASEPALELNRIYAADGSDHWPRYRVERISGLKGLGDPEDNRDAPVGRLGEIARLSERRGKSISYEGTIEARSLLELEEAEAALRAAFADLSSEGRMDVSWHPLLAAFAAVPTKFYEARALICEVIDVQEQVEWKRAFVVSLRQGDARYFDEETESTAELAIASSLTDYTLTATLPDLFRGPTLTLSMPAPAAVIDVVVTHIASGKTMTLTFPAGWEGEQLTLDWTTKRILDAGGADASDLLSSGDKALWMTYPFRAGANQFKVRVTEHESGVLATTLSPKTVEDAAGVGTNAWSNPGNAKVADGAQASVNIEAGAETHYLKATNYGYTIPSWHKILGISPAAKKNSLELATKDGHVRVVKGGVVQTAVDRASSEPWPIPSLTTTYGGPSDLWGLGWTPADMNSSGFGWALSAKDVAALTHGASVDAMPMTVYHEPGTMSVGAGLLVEWERGYY